MEVRLTEDNVERTRVQFIVIVRLEPFMRERERERVREKKKGNKKNGYRFN